MNLHARLDIEIVADVAVLKIEIEQANTTPARAFAGLELNPDLDRKRDVADATGARDECNHDGFGRGWRVKRLAQGSTLADARQNVRDLVGCAVGRRPVGTAGLHQALVVAGR